MKKIISIIISVFMCFSFSACSGDEILMWLFDRNNYVTSKIFKRDLTEIPLSGNLFDAEVMQTVDLEWLQKPENVQDERYESKTYLVKYCCCFNSIEEAKEYMTYVFEGLIENQCSLGTFEESRENPEYSDFLRTYTYRTVLLSKEFNDFFQEIDSYDIFRFFAYFTTDEKTWIKEHDRYLLTNSKKICMEVVRTANEDGLYEFFIFIASWNRPTYIREPNE